MSVGGSVVVWLVAGGCLGLFVVSGRKLCKTTKEMEIWGGLGRGTEICAVLGH